MFEQMDVGVLDNVPSTGLKPLRKDAQPKVSACIGDDCPKCLHLHLRNMGAPTFTFAKVKRWRYCDWISSKNVNLDGAASKGELSAHFSVEPGLAKNRGHTLLQSSPIIARLSLDHAIARPFRFQRPSSDRFVRRGACVLRVLHPDGSQETRMFADKDACVEQTMALREELIECGWWPWRETARRSPYES